MQFLRTILETMTEATTEAFLIRLIIAVVLSLVTGLLYLAVDKSNKRTIKNDSDKFVYYFLNKRTTPWIFYATVIGYFLLTGLSPEEGGGYTLPMLVYSMEKSVWMDILWCISFPIIPALIWVNITFRSLRLRSGLYIFFGVFMGLSLGMLFGQVAELLMRLLGLVYSYIGFLGYILFYAIILLQIAWMCGMLLCGAGLFILSFFHDDTLAEMRVKREMWKRTFDGSGGGYSGGGSIGSDWSGGGSSYRNSRSGTGNTAYFPDTLYMDGREFRRASASSDTATYYDPRTGIRKTIRNTDVPGYD